MRRTITGVSARRRRASTAFAEGIHTSQLIGAARERLFWYKRPAAPKLTARRGSAQAALLSMGPAPALTDHYRWAEEHQPGSYEWAKAHAHESATAYVGLNLHRPKFSTNWGTAHFAGKPYHWRQDYTGQLKLAAGESPW